MLGFSALYAAARASTVPFIPARMEKVDHMSQMWISSFVLVPRAFAATSPPEAKAATLTPPSKSVYLPFMNQQ